MALTTYNIGTDEYWSPIGGDNVSVVATSGNHIIFLGGSGDTVVATGGMELIMANAGNNTITTGDGNDSLYLSGGNNVANAGGGTNTIYDMANPGDTIVMPGASNGFDNIFLTPGADPSLDFRAALAGTDWNGNTATLSSYIHASSSGGATAISMSATAGGAATAIASLTNIAGPQWDLSTVLAHAVT